MRFNPQLMEKIRESLASVLPITAIVLVLSISIAPLASGALVLFLYKPVVSALRKTGFVEAKPQKSGSSKFGIYIFAGVLLLTCILLILVIKGIL